MMRKFKPGLLILTVLFCAPLILADVANSPSDSLTQESVSKKETKKERRERKKLEAKKRREEKRKARELKRQERKEKTKSKKEKKCKSCKKSKVKKEKSAKEKKSVKKPKTKKEKLAIMAEKHKQEKAERAQKRQVRAYTMAAQDMAAEQSRKAAKKAMLQTKLQNEEKREKLMADWKTVRGIEVVEDYKDGMYADLYKIPAWPFHMMYADYKKDLFQVTAKYDYAVDSFSSKGSSQNLSNLEFGESSFKFSDILLALKLNEKEILSKRLETSLIWNNLLGNDQLSEAYLSGFKFDNNLVFNAKSQEHMLSLDYLRYLKGKDICIGFQLPIGYKSHKLKVSSPIGFGTASFTQIEDRNFANPPVAQNLNYFDWNDIPSQVYLQEYLNFVLAAKPSTLAYYPKSSIIGIGDLSTFITFQAESRYFEKFLLGFKVLWPTAKEADTKKLWAPTLGNGGFTELVLYTSMLFNHQKSYFNPHIMLQVDCKVPGHIDKRVPKILTGSRGTSDYVTSDNQRLADMMALGDHVKFITPDANGYSPSFSNYPDSTIAAFADNVKSVKITPGAEFNLRLGNIFEKLIFRRAFLDIFYDFRARLKDYVDGALPRDQWDADKLKDRTNQIAHKIGLLYDYQFDYQTRLRIGFDYVFAGINVPSTISGNLSLAAEF
ncbi:MAG: hypothetical protein WC436_05410 [Candidatus Babeliales bacterium]